MVKTNEKTFAQTEREYAHCAENAYISVHVYVHEMKKELHAKQKILIVGNCKCLNRIFFRANYINLPRFLKRQRAIEL